MATINCCSHLEASYVMNNKLSVYSALTWFWVFGLSLLGGLASSIRKLNQSTKPLSLGKLFIRLSGELVIAAFAGLLTFFLCQAWGLSNYWTAVFVSVSGHLGSRAIDGVADIWINILKNAANK